MVCLLRLLREPQLEELPLGGGELREDRGRVFFRADSREGGHGEPVRVGREHIGAGPNARLLHRRIHEQPFERRRDAIAIPAGGGNVRPNPESHEVLGVVGTVAPCAHHELRNPRRERLAERSDATVMNDGGRPRQQRGKVDEVVDPGHVRGELVRKERAVRGDQNDPAAESLRGLESEHEELSFEIEPRAARDDDGVARDLVGACLAAKKADMTKIGGPRPRGGREPFRP